MNPTIFLDNAATTPIAPEVMEVMTDVMKNTYGNPSSIHHMGRTAKNTIEQSRKTIANHLGVSPSEIVFTSGGTESNNMALRCCVKDLGVTRIITSPLEHHCILHTVACLQRSDIQIEFVNVKHCGRADMDHLQELLTNSDQKTLVTLMHANNEIGTINDLEAIGSLCREHGAYYMSDTVQTMAHIPMNLNDLPLDFASGSAHKFHGPKGAGFLYVSNAATIKSMITGGGQERSMRAGTENIIGIAGLAKAFDMAYNHLDEWPAYVRGLKQYMADQLKEHIPGISFNGDISENSLYTVLSTKFPPHKKNEYLIMHLDMARICASGGSACSSGSAKSSHVINHLNGEEESKTIRFSFSHFTTKSEIDTVIQSLVKILELPTMVETV